MSPASYRTAPPRGTRRNSSTGIETAPIDGLRRTPRHHSSAISSARGPVLRAAPCQAWMLQRSRTAAVTSPPASRTCRLRRKPDVGTSATELHRARPAGRAETLHRATPPRRQRVGPFTPADVLEHRILVGVVGDLVVDVRRLFGIREAEHRQGSGRSGFASNTCAAG
jgi:hypothetical protein